MFQRHNLQDRRMATFYLPFVSRGNFAALEALTRSKKNYSDWLSQAANWQADAKRHVYTIQQVSVNPKQFRRYLDKRGFPYSREQLLGFAEWCGKSHEMDSPAASIGQEARQALGS
jgi:hypothetical protein